jgi:hypothetical protein
LAATLFPAHAGRFKRVCDDGLADAVLVGVAAVADPLRGQAAVGKAPFKGS